MKHLSFVKLYIIALLLAASVYWAFTPGLMSFDSLQQYRQTNGLIPLVDSHPVIMVYAWRLMSLFVDGAGGLLAFNQFMYWTTICIIAMLLARSFGGRLILMLSIGLFPPLVLMSIHVWKDAGMMWSLGLASACVYAYSRSQRAIWIVVALCSLFYAVAIRVNGFIPAIFLITALAYLVFAARRFKTPARWVGAFVTSGLVIGLFYFGISLINQNAHRVYGFGTLAVWDIASISIAEKENLLPEYLERQPISGDPLIVLAEKNNSEANYPVYAYVSPYPDQAHEHQLFNDWLAVITEYPTAYLQHRAHVFAVLSGQSVDGKVYYPFHRGIDDNDLGIEFEHVQRHVPQLMAMFDWLSRLPVYRVCLYEIISLAVLLYSLYRMASASDSTRSYFVAACISLSGITNALSLFFLATAADFRYMVWTIFAAIISALITINARNYERKSRALKPEQSQ